MAVNTIKRKKYLDIVIEHVANAAITPGELLEFLTTEKVQAHSSAGQNVTPVMFALEDELQGNGIDDDYSAGDEVQIWIPQPGEVVRAILADGENVSFGNALESAGNGALQKHVADTGSWEGSENVAFTTYPENIVGIAWEAKDLSGSSGEESSGPLGYNKRIDILIV